MGPVIAPHFNLQQTFTLLSCLQAFLRAEKGSDRFGYTQISVTKHLKREASETIKGDQNNLFFCRPGFDFIKVGCTAQIIDITQSIYTLRLCPTIEKLFTGIKVWHRAQNIGAG